MGGGAEGAGKSGVSLVRRALILAVCLLFLGGWAVLGTTSLANANRAPDFVEAGHSDPALSPGPASGVFGLGLLRVQPPGNVVLAPGSIATALAMAGTGATGPTAAQMARALHLRGPAAFGAVGKLQRSIASEQAAVGEGRPNAPTLAMANGLFLQQGFPLKPAFLSGLRQRFGATPEAVDFAGNLPGSIAAINSWVSDHTSGIIPQLLLELPEETRLVLTNAVYLMADWRHRFDPRETAQAPFHGRAGPTPIEFMHQTTRLRYGSGPGYRAVDLPYRASTLSLLVVLPVDQEVGVLQRQLSTGGLTRVARGLSRRTVKLSLPRFHLNTRTNLNEALRSLGMTIALSDSANFSGITAAESLKIGVVEHAADFAVDEKGSVAAAATAVGVVPTSAPVVPRDAVEFNANRPFLFFVREDSTGAVVFAGRLADPGSAEPG